VYYTPLFAPITMAARDPPPSEQHRNTEARIVVVVSKRVVVAFMLSIWLFTQTTSKI